MKRYTWQVWWVMGLCAGAGLFLVRAAEKSHELPETIAKLVRKAFPEADIVHVSREETHDDLAYNVKLKNGPDGRRVGLDIKTEAGITKIEEELRPDELPPKVQKALRRAFPNAPIEEAQKESEIRVVYEIDIIVEGKRREVMISPWGKILAVD
jgi:hypothetical protein